MAAAHAQRLEDSVAQLKAAVERGQVPHIRGEQRSVDPHVARSRRGRHAPASMAPIDDSGPRAFDDGLVPLRLGVAAPGDPAADMQRQPLAVGHERPDQDARAHPPVRPEPQHRPAIRAAPDRLQPLDQLHRPQLGGTGDAAAGERGREDVEGVEAGPKPARDRRHEMLHRGRSLEAEQPGNPDRSGLADPPEVVAQDVDDHHVLGLVLGAGQQLARQRPVLLTRPASRPGALDRVGRDHALRIDREERLRRGGQQGARPARGRAGADVEEAGEQGGIARAQAAEDGPWIAVERGLEAAREVGLVDLAPTDRGADGLDVPDPRLV